MHINYNKTWYKVSKVLTLGCIGIGVLGLCITKYVMCDILLTFSSSFYTILMIVLFKHLKYFKSNPQIVRIKLDEINLTILDMASKTKIYIILNDKNNMHSSRVQDICLQASFTSCKSLHYIELYQTN